jgi:hypothetical protein
MLVAALVGLVVVPAWFEAWGFGALLLALLLVAVATVRWCQRHELKKLGMPGALTEVERQLGRPLNRVEMESAFVDIKNGVALSTVVSYLIAGRV